MSDEIDPDLYINDFAEFIRDLIRAVAAEDSSSSLSNASRRIRNLFGNADRLPKNLNWYEIIESAVKCVKPPYKDKIDYESDYDILAKLSARYLAELTASDLALTARLNKVRRAIEDEINFIPQRRQLRREGL